MFRENWWNAFPIIFYLNKPRPWILMSSVVIGHGQLFISQVVWWCSNDMRFKSCVLTNSGNQFFRGVITAQKEALNPFNILNRFKAPWSQQKTLTKVTSIYIFGRFREVAITTVFSQNIAWPFPSNREFFELTEKAMRCSNWFKVDAIGLSFQISKKSQYKHGKFFFTTLYRKVIRSH